MIGASVIVISLQVGRSHYRFLSLRPHGYPRILLQTTLRHKAPCALPSSPCGPPAIHQKRMSGHHRSCRTSEVHGRGRDVFDLADATKWDAREDALAPSGILERSARQLGCDERGRDRIYGDPVLRQFDRE